MSLEQDELERIEDEQTLEELQILRETVYVSFRKQEEIAEVRNLDDLHYFPIDIMFSLTSLRMLWLTFNIALSSTEEIDITYII